MCGITGFVGNGNQADGDSALIVRAMAESLTHRGPDDCGVWTDATAGIAFGHRRLSVIDLSDHGKQPMQSHSGRYVIAYNGEVYNFPELRKELDLLGGNVTWTGSSDTEVVLASIEQWGIRKALEKFNGMFAFAVWDRIERHLYLARDRVGKKPVYYGWGNGVLIFGSELKAFKLHPAFNGEIDRNSMALYLRYNYVPAPHSIYKNICKLMPGTFLKVTSPYDERASSTECYWQAKEIVRDGLRNPLVLSDEDAVHSLDSLLSESVRKRMIADVPIGVFLSGGVDSSAVVALMQAQSNRPIKSYSIGFQEKQYDEAVYAKEVARHLGTDHTELYVTPEDAMSVVQDLPVIYDEPFSDSSQIPTFLVSQLARREVTVSLSGDGGDELFGGYNRYVWGKWVWDTFGGMPLPLRRTMASIIMAFSPRTLDALLQSTSFVFGKHLQQQNPGYKLHKLADAITASSKSDLYRSFVSQWKRPSEVVIGSQEPRSALQSEDDGILSDDFSQYMMYQDLATYLPDDILVKVDRASMAVSLEVRNPLLDHTVVEFAWRLPLNLKIRDGVSKWLLRQVLYKYVPKKLIERPKVGFEVPIDMWLRGPLRDWAESLLDERRLREQGYFNVRHIRDCWHAHLSGKRNMQYYLWSVLMFQAWDRGVGNAYSSPTA